MSLWNKLLSGAKGQSGKHCQFHGCGSPATRGQYCDRHSTERAREKGIEGLPGTGPAAKQKEATSQPNSSVPQPKPRSENIENQDEDFASEIFAFDLITSEEREEQDFRQIPDLREIPAFVNANNLEQAEPLVEAALQRYPDYGFVHYFRSALWERTGQIERAKRACEDGIKASTRKQMLCHRLGLLEFHHGSLREAVRWWIRSILLQLRSGRMVDTNSFLYLSQVADSIGNKLSASKLLTLSATGAMARSV